MLHHYPDLGSAAFWLAKKIGFIQTEALPIWDASPVWNFCTCFLRNHFTGEQEVVLQNIFSGWGWVCCWLFSLLWRRNFIIRVIYSHLCTANCIKSSTQHCFKPNWWIPLKTLLFLSENNAQMGMQIFVTV